MEILKPIDVSDILDNPKGFIRKIIGQDSDVKVGDIAYFALPKLYIKIEDASDLAMVVRQYKKERVFKIIKT